MLVRSGVNKTRKSHHLAPSAQGREGLEMSREPAGSSKAAWLSSGRTSCLRELPCFPVSSFDG